MTNVIIRLETEQDYRAVEELTREAFWNVYKPGPPAKKNSIPTPIPRS